MDAETIAIENWAQDRDGCRAKFHHPVAYQCYVLSMIDAGRGDELVQQRSAPAPRASAQAPQRRTVFGLAATLSEIEQDAREYRDNAEEVLRGLDADAGDDDDHDDHDDINDADAVIPRASLRWADRV